MKIKKSYTYDGNAAYDVDIIVGDYIAEIGNIKMTDEQVGDMKWNNARLDFCRVDNDMYNLSGNMKFSQVLDVYKNILKRACNLLDSIKVEEIIASPATTRQFRIYTKLLKKANINHVIHLKEFDGDSDEVGTYGNIIINVKDGVGIC